ncbi:triose-phosphate isomerase [Patescibacteria group bacterium]
MKKLIIANWKMNPSSLKEAQRLFNAVKKASISKKNIRTIICPPFPFLAGITKGRSSVVLGAQDVFWEKKGAYTGEVSCQMLRSLGVSYVMIGHSERRENLKEDSEIVRKKLKTAITEGLNVILCVGEKKRDSDGSYLHFVKEEIISAMKGIKRQDLSKITITYEPIWAISSTKRSKNVTPKDAVEMSIFITRILSTIYSAKLAAKVKVIYGGSADPENTKDYLSNEYIKGLLVGAESLKPARFAKILEVANKV